ncbi:tyrosine-type recombinase/integrase [Pseudomonas syringae]|uniref:site-specific integrase n=1 Tax=Pseudomonas syringae TaxID=317 RepID=UPI002EC8F968|nr:site-specific integrase [Pseudomonas alliivorans]
MKDNRTTIGLLVKARDDFGVPIAAEEGCDPVLRLCGGLPLMSWPDYSACFEANCWMDELRSKGLDPATCVNYGYLITWILRYAYENSLALYEFNDYHFVKFMRRVKQEDRAVSNRSRSMKQNGIIGRKTLDFLELVGKLYNVLDLVAPQGRIQATKKLVQIRNFIGTRFVEVWFHPDVPVTDNTISIKNKILSAPKVEAIKNAVRTSASGTYIRNRQRCLIVVLEETGARRKEAAQIPVSAVWEAKKMLSPSLLINTAKKGGHSQRLVEISPALLTLLDDYVKFDLTPFLKQRNIDLHGDCPLFASAKTKKAIQPNTITAEFLHFKKITGIEGAVSPHMFRHWTVTRDRIEHFQKNPIEKNIASIIGLKGVPEFALRSMEKHGHSSIHSQVPYNHFEQLIDHTTSEDGLTSRSVSALRVNLETISELANKGRKTKSDAIRLQHILDQTLAILAPKGDQAG